MATNLSNIPPLFQGADLDAIYQERLAEYQKLMSIDLEDLGITSSANMDLTPAIPPLDPNSQEYKDIANSWSNRLGSSWDSTKSMVNEGLGLLFNQIGADEIAASYRRDAEQNLQDRAARAQPEITPAITEEIPEISSKVADGEVLAALSHGATTVKALISEALPSMGVTVGGFATAKAIAPLVARIPYIGPPAALLTWAVGALAPGYLMMSGETYKRAKELGANEPEANVAGIAGGIGGSLLDFWFGGVVVNNAIRAVGRKQVLNTFKDKFGKETAEEVLKNAEKFGTAAVLREAVKGGIRVGAVGGITEASQVATTEAAAAVAAGKAIDPQDLAKRMIDEGALGVFGGGTLGGVSGAFSPLTRREAQRKLEQIKEDDEALHGLGDTVSRVDQEPDLIEADQVPNVRMELLDKLVRRPISFLKDQMDKYPLRQQVYNSFANFFNDTYNKAGTLLQRSSNTFEEIVQEYGKTFKLPFTRAIPKQLTDDIGRLLADREANIDQSKYAGEEGQRKLEYLKNLTRNESVDQNGNVIKAGPLRQLFNDARTLMTDEGVAIEYVTNYLTQSYKFPLAGLGRKRAKQKMIRILQNNQANDETVRDNLATNAVEIVENIAEHEGTYSPHNTVDLFADPAEPPTMEVSKRSPELPRKIPDEVVLQLDEAGLVNNNAQTLLNKYIINAARRRGIQDLQNRYGKRGDELGLTPLERDRLRDTFQALQNNYKRIEGRTAKKISDFLVTFGYITTLPFAGLVSLSEPAVILSRVNPKHAIMAGMRAGRVTLDKAIRSIIPKHKISELENEYNAMQQTADLALTDIVRDLGETTFNRRITNAFFKATLLAQVTQFSRQMAYSAAKSQLQEDLLLVSDEMAIGEPTVAGASARKRLREMGLRNIFSERKKLLKEDDRQALQKVEDQSLLWAKGEIEVAPDLIRNSLAKTVDEVIMSPNVVNRPLWMSDPRLAMVAQLKGFMMVFGNTIGPKLWTDVIKPMSPVHRTREGLKGKMPTLELESTLKYGLMFTMFLAAMYGLQTVKDAIRYEDEDDSPLSDMDEVETMFYFLKQSNLLGAGNVLINAAESQKYGLSPFFAVAGPVPGKIEQLMKAFYNVADDRPRSLANWMAKNTPFVGALGTDRRSEFPVFGTDAWEELLEDLLD